MGNGRFSIVTLVLIAIIISTNFFSNQVYGLEITAGIGTNPFAVGIDISNNRIYIANQGSNNISVIDGTPGSPTENTVINTIPIGMGPVSISVNPNNHRIYTANQGDNTVSVIDGTTDTVIDTITVGNGPVGILVNPSTQRVYVGNVFDGTLTIIDDTKVDDGIIGNEIIDTVVLSVGAARIGIDSNLDKLYVVNFFSTTTFVIDIAPGSLTENTLLTTINVGNAPSNVIADPATNKAYVTNRGSNSVSVIDTITDTVIDSIPVGAGPNAIDGDFNNNRVYVVHGISDTASIIDTTTNSVIATVPAGTSSGVGVDTSVNKVYVANGASNSVTVIELGGNLPPIANAGPNQAVNEGDFITLDGTGSSDPDGDPITFSWTQTAGPIVTLSDDASSNPTFTASQVDANTLLIFELEVNDGVFTSPPDIVEIVVRDIITFQVPLSQTTSGLEGSVVVGDVAADTTISFAFETPPGTTIDGELQQSIVTTTVAGDNVEFDFTVTPKIPPSLPLLTNSAFFYDIEFKGGIDFSNPANLAADNLPKSKFLVDKDFDSGDTFSDGCPVVKLFLFNENTKRWEQQGDPLKPNANKLYSPNSFLNLVTVIDLTTNSIDTIPVTGGPFSIAVNIDDNRIYTANQAGTASVIDTLTNTVIATIPVGVGPRVLEFNPNTNLLYVGNSGDNTVSVIDLSSNTVIDTIPVGLFPTSINVDPFNRIFVSNILGGDISVIDGTPGSPTQHTVIDTIQVGNLPAGLVLDPRDNRMFLSIFGGNTVRVLDGTPGSPTLFDVIDTIEVGTSPTLPILNIPANKLYVSNSAADYISVIDLSLNAEIAQIPVGPGPFANRVNEKSGTLFTVNTSEGTLSVIDILPGSPTENSEIDRFSIGIGHFGQYIIPATSNPVRIPSSDILDPNTGEILQCAYVGEQPHYSKFAIGGIKALSSQIGSSSSSTGGKAPSMESISFDGVSTDNDDGILEFGGVIIDEIDPVNNIPSQTVVVGTPFELRLPFYEDNGIGSLQHVAVYFLQGDEKTIYDSQTSIIYEPNNPVEFSDENNFITNVSAKGLVKSAYNVDVIFGMTFNFPTEEPLDVIVRSWDKHRRSSDIRFNDLLLIVESNSKNNLPLDTSIEEVPDWSKSIQSSLTKSTTVFKETYEGSQITFDLENGESITKISGIPIWVKNNAYWWSEEKIDDNDFVAGIQHLIDQNIITVPKRHVISILETPPTIEIPEWVKNNASWWSKGEISDDEFIKSIQWLIEEGIMTV